MTALTQQSQRQPTTRILTASTKTITINIVLGPALSHSLYLFTALHRHLSTTTLSLLLHTYQLLSHLPYLLLLQRSLYASQILLIQSLYATKLAIRTTKEVMKLGWKGLEPLRKKLFFEFMVFILGAGGNGLILLVFWPGWLVVAGGLLMTSWVRG